MNQELLRHIYSVVANDNILSNGKHYDWKISELVDITDDQAGKLSVEMETAVLNKLNVIMLRHGEPNKYYITTSKIGWGLSPQGAPHVFRKQFNLERVRQDDKKGRPKTWPVEIAEADTDWRRHIREALAGNQKRLLQPTDRVEKTIQKMFTEASDRLQRSVLEHLEATQLAAEEKKMEEFVWRWQDIGFDYERANKALADFNQRGKYNVFALFLPRRFSLYAKEGVPSPTGVAFFSLDNTHVSKVQELCPTIEQVSTVPSMCFISCMI